MLIILQIMKAQIPKAIILFHVLDHCELGICNIGLLVKRRAKSLTDYWRHWQSCMLREFITCVGEVSRLEFLGGKNFENWKGDVRIINDINCIQLTELQLGQYFYKTDLHLSSFNIVLFNCSCHPWNSFKDASLSVWHKMADWFFFILFLYFCCIITYIKLLICTRIWATIVRSEIC